MGGSSSKAWGATDIPSMVGKTAVVTGANAGIGTQTVRLFASNGATVVLCCRDTAKGEAAKREVLAAIPNTTDANKDVADRILVEKLDLAALASIKEFAARANGGDSPMGTALANGLDFVVCNAGVMEPATLTKSADGFEIQWATNHLGHYALVAGLLPLLKKRAAALTAAGSGERPRVVPVSSIRASTGSLKSVADVKKADLFTYATRTYAPRPAYDDSKQANLLFAQGLKKRCGGWLDVVACHPGVCATNLFRHNGYDKVSFLFQSPEAGALLEMRAATEPATDLLPKVEPASGAGDGPGGISRDPTATVSYIGTGGGSMKGTPVFETPAAHAVDVAVADALWDATAAATGVAYEA